MYRLLLLFSVLPIAICLVLCWWSGTRVLWGEGRRTCRCDLGRWLPDPDDKKSVHRAEQSASQFGAALRRKALKQWKEQQPKEAKARTNHRHFGLAVPPLSGIIAVFAVVVGKIPPLGAIAVFIAATAVSCLVGLLSLPKELTVIRRYAAQPSFQGAFPDRDEQERIIRCAMGHAWQACLPAVLKWFQPRSGR